MRVSGRARRAVRMMYAVMHIYMYLILSIIYKCKYIYLFACACVCRQQQWPGCVGSDGGGGGDDGPDLAHVAEHEVPARLSESLTVLP